MALIGYRMSELGRESSALFEIQGNRTLRQRKLQRSPQTSSRTAPMSAVAPASGWLPWATDSSP
ncbi:hypothetical protein BE04_44015 [Sorangium cellulosum]|uniref:Uncharacterized protein n=1 Tax=Sorangium cellulosum TaxID=56 RepID=A0A150P438_SORCE|nr:hypothetical protein BE04_44015 [Sorangium cellulosum]